MKKLSLAAAFILLAFLSHATTWTVDNTGGSGAQFTSITSAINGANTADTILVHSSQTSYGYIQINKQVVLIGPGHKPTVNQNLPASVTTFQLVNGSSGTTIEGFFIGTIEGAVFNVVNNITIRNNYFNSFSSILGTYGDNSGAANWMIEGNVFVDPGGCGGCVSIDIRNSALGTENWTIRNNFFQNSSLSQGNLMFANFRATTVFANNIIVHIGSSDIFSTSNFSIIENNIFYLDVNPSVQNGCNNCGFNNNLFYSTGSTLADVPGVGNIVNANPEFVFLTGDVANWNYNNDYHLASSSPAVGSAADGDDMGLYGADYNFRMNGYTNDIPRLTEVLPQYLVVPVNGTFTIDFSGTSAGQ
jgi:hypothetical protein